MNSEVILRPFSIEDVASFHKNVYSDPTLRCFLDASAAPDEAEAERYIRSRIQYEKRPRFYDYAIVLAENKEVIGEVNAAYVKENLADIGYVIGASRRGHGYGTQAVCLLLEHLRNEGIQTAYAAVRPENMPSRGLLEHIGMKPTIEVPPAIKRREEETELCWYVTHLSV